MTLFLLNFRNINGFLNTGKGGTIYLGIVDDGKVKGLLLTQYQVSCHVLGMLSQQLLGRMFVGSYDISRLDMHDWDLE